MNKEKPYEFQHQPPSETSSPSAERPKAEDVAHLVGSIDDTDPSGAIFAVMRLGAYEVRERIGRHVLKWDDEKQSDYLDGVNARLQAKLRAKLFIPTRVKASTDPARKERLADAKKQQALIKQARLEEGAARRRRRERIAAERAQARFPSYDQINDHFKGSLRVTEVDYEAKTVTVTADEEDAA